VPARRCPRLSLAGHSALAWSCQLDAFGTLSPPEGEVGRRPDPGRVDECGRYDHIRFEPRIWLAGRLLMSKSTAVLRMASAIAAAMISLRLRSLRSLYRLAMTSSTSMHRL
jgi:hypothetical protein